MNKKYKVNKGEWSEFYTLLKLLADQKLYAADEQLKKLEEIFYPVLKVITAKDSNKEMSYELDDSDGIKIYNPSTSTILNVSRQSIKDRIYRIYESIKTSTETTFEIPLAQEILNDLGSPEIKGYSTKKADIVLKIHDINTGHKPEVGFSIKSQLGGASTLLNAGETTNFIFEIENFRGTPEDVNSIEGHAKIRGRMKSIFDNGGKLKFVRNQSKTFQDNLMKVETLLPAMIAEMLVIYFSGKGATMNEISSELERIGYSFLPDQTSQSDLFEFKLKNLLMNVALGMTPATAWDGLLQAHGGYIVVREDGEIVCYHLYNLDAFRNYLFRNTKLDTSSTTKHKFGSIYEENGRLYLKLNLQIRFTD